MGFLTSPLPVKIETKIFEKVIINCTAEKCYLQFDTEKWEFVLADKKDHWLEIRPDGTTWLIRNVDVFPRMDAILEDTFQNIQYKKVPIRIKELHVWNWLRLPHLFETIQVEKLQLGLILHNYINGYLQAFQNKTELSHVTILNYRHGVEFLDDLKLVECDNLLLVTRMVDEPCKMTGFRAKRWEITETYRVDAPPLILEFVDKMMIEKPEIQSKYMTAYPDEFDMQPLIELVKNKYPNAQLCGDGRNLLTIKLEDREVNVCQSRQYNSRYTSFKCGVKMEAKGTAKPDSEMNRLERFCLRKSDELCVCLVDLIIKLKKRMQFQQNKNQHSFKNFDHLIFFFLDNPLFLVGNLLIIPLLLAFFLLYFFCLSSMYPIFVPFLIVFIIFNAKYTRDCWRKDPFLFDIYRCN